jgi:hypothetical protein
MGFINKLHAVFRPPSFITMRKLDLLPIGFLAVPIDLMTHINRLAVT